MAVLITLIKAVLLRSENWTLESIAQALRVHVDTIRAHLVDYSEENKLKPENGGSKSHLNEEQTNLLIGHLYSTSLKIPS